MLNFQNCFEWKNLISSCHYDQKIMSVYVNVIINNITMNLYILDGINYKSTFHKSL